ncbi:hypothetical protein [Mangrovibacterium diazotrophicum]|uniref:Uncharacterized protein n=1 Tax=Mangrovibacterium diazotrophicum TaxID=1261403 RepID=A0A419WA73_9BACT|nr:hypothetical protein [Mangrovibacterium diazotrophicum]RKD92316.1 hypothetical protein BC643_2687 [Mangrovibacterium diazotrophicum]
MKRVIRIVAGILTALLPITGAGMFCILIYNQLQSITGIIVASLLFLGAVWFGVIVFKSIYAQGFVKFITPVFATPDLDELAPAEEEGKK